MAVTIHIGILIFFYFTDPLGMVGVAWSKNITDGLCALGLYFFIILKEPTKSSWV
jgi:Na+-driven multidrug efflux pump